MLKLPKTQQRSKIVIPCPIFPLSNNEHENYLNLYTLVPRVTFMWTQTLNIEKIFQQQAELVDLDIESFKSLFDADDKHEALGDAFHTLIENIKSETFYPFNLISNINDFISSLQDGQFITLKGSHLRNLITSSTPNNVAWVIFDPDVSYDLSIMKDQTTYYFFIQDTEVNQRGRIVYEKIYQINLNYSLKWSEKIDDIFSLNQDNWREIAKHYGVIVPPHSESPVDYLIDHLQYNYDKSDIDLILEAGVMVNFNDRRGLNIKLAKFKRPRKKIYFVVLTEDIVNKASNKSLTTFDTVLEASTELVFGYGNYDSYVAFSALELLQSFIERQFESTFTKPFDYPNEFEDNEIEEIDDLARFFTEEYQIARDLRTKIANIRLMKYQNTEELRQFHQEFINGSIKYKSDISSLFESIFYAGMYMRQWKGKGNPFPKTENDSKEMGRTEDTSFEIGASDEINKARRLIVSINSSIISQLSIKTHNGSGNIVDYGYPLRSFIKRVKRGDYCIRMASLPLIVTAKYYESIIPMSRLPPINIVEFEPIY